MKQLAAIIFLGMMGGVQAQTTSRDVELFERYENGKLVEQSGSVIENGVPIEHFDFDEEKRKIQLKSSEMNLKMDEMKRGMDMRMNEMDQKMEEFQQRSNQMRLEMDKRMKEFQQQKAAPRNMELKQAPAPKVQPSMGTTAPNEKFT
jgi:septin family protein